MSEQPAQNTVCGVGKGYNGSGSLIIQLICGLDESDFVDIFTTASDAMLFRAINREARATVDKNLRAMIQHKFIPSITGLPSNLKASYYLRLIHNYFHSEFNFEFYAHNQAFRRKCVKLLTEGWKHAEHLNFVGHPDPQTMHHVCFLRYLRTEGLLGNVKGRAIAVDIIERHESSLYRYQNRVMSRSEEADRILLHQISRIRMRYIDSIKNVLLHAFVIESDAKITAGLIGT